MYRTSQPVRVCVLHYAEIDYLCFFHLLKIIERRRSSFSGRPSKARGVRKRRNDRFDKKIQKQVFGVIIISVERRKVFIHDDKSTA